jgi:hypothetical protein
MEHTFTHSDSVPTSAIEINTPANIIVTCTGTLIAATLDRHNVGDMG